MSLAATRAAPLRFAGRPVGHWGFGLRTWLAMMLALYVAFWLQLGGASSAATCVGILALPTRGQAFQKALYRFVGTVIGVAASFVIAGLFNQTRELFLVAVAAWIALCVFAASLLDGQRAYGAVLSGYTVAIVAVADIDSPQDTFSSGINRGAAITIGILATMVVSDLFAAPNVLSGLIRRIDATHGKVRAFVLDTVERGRADPVATTRLMGEITAFHPDITALPTESIGGSRRWGAAYWKPVQTGLAEEPGDTETVAHLADLPASRAHTPRHSLAGQPRRGLRRERRARRGDRPSLRPRDRRRGRDPGPHRRGPWRPRDPQP